MEFVKWEKQNNIGSIRIDRQKELNALNTSVLTELDDIIGRIAPSDIRVVLLRGAGEKAFAAGADIAQMSKLNKAEAKAWSTRGNEIFRKIENLAVPVIAVIFGYALGGGCELALSCDIRLAADTAVFSQPETSLGIVPGFGGTQRLMRTIGKGKAKEMIYTGRRVHAQEALKIGLVNAVYHADVLMDEAMKTAEKIARNAPAAVRASKRAINEGSDMDISEGLFLEQELFGNCFETLDQQNAMEAFIKKDEKQPFLDR